MFLFVNLNQRNVREFIMNPFRPKMPPFGVAYVASILKTIGIKCVLHDDNHYEYSDAQLRDLFRKYKGELQTVGLTSVSTTLNQLARVARISKEILPEVPIIVGGPHARLLPEDIIQYPEVDVVFTSEAELAILDYAKGKELSEIGGIMYRGSGEIIENPVTSFIHNLDDIPFPDYSLFNISDYHTTKGIAKRHPNSYIITSRGCPYKCTFCSSKTLNPTDKKIVRFRSPENVMAEIEMLVKKYMIKELFFSDDMFTGNTKHLFGICEGIIKLKLDVIWVCQTHVNNINQEKLKMMKKAGCHQVCFGVESGDPEIQKAIQKNLDLPRVKDAVRMTQRKGIDVRCSFMFGNQYETPETMRRTIDFAKSLASDFASFNIATPFPGTYLRAWAIENGYLINKSYEALDSTTYTLVTPSLPPGTVEKYCDKAFRLFYYRPAYVFRRLRHIRDTEDVIRYVKSASYAFKSIPTVFGTMWQKIFEERK
jgi:radical SAM superfamily enzyme YgiQ (UPF0313 family)